MREHGLTDPEDLPEYQFIQLSMEMEKLINKYNSGELEEGDFERMMYLDEQMKGVIRETNGNKKS